MKSFFIVAFMTIVSSLAFGQLAKNTWLVGGSGSLYSYKENYTAPLSNFTGKFTSVDVTASIGYFFIDKLVGGVRPYFSTYKGESSGGAIPNDFKFAVGPFLRYYFLPQEKQFNILTDVSYQIGINQGKGGDNPKGKFNTFSLMTGAEVFFNSSVGLEFLVGYKHQIASFENSPGAYTSDRRGFQTLIGSQFHLEK